LIKANTDNNSANSFKDEEKAVLGTNKMTALELMKQGGSYKCGWDQSQNGSTSNIIVYIDGQMLRQEMKMKTPTIDIESSILVKDGYQYSWNSMTPGIATRTRMVENTGIYLKPNTPASSMEVTLAGLDEQAQAPGYSCQSWTADASIFTPPANVKFVGN